MRRPRSIEGIVAGQFKRSEAAAAREEAFGTAWKRPVVVISRGMGSGARIIAEKVAGDLGWSLWSREILETIVSDGHVSRRVVEAFDEKTRSEIRLIVDALIGNHEIANFVYTKHLARVVTAIARVGNAIILGRGASFLLPDAMHVRIDASESLRIKNMMAFEGLSLQEATEKVRRSDRERRDFLVNTFGKERVQNVRFDLQLWMDRFTNDDAAQIIEAAIRARSASGGRQSD